MYVFLRGDCTASNIRPDLSIQIISRKMYLYMHSCRRTNKYKIVYS